MSSSRPKLTLDEQSFQDMLAAAFTIQEHNARRRKEARPPARACRQCGISLENDGPLCERCSAQEARPGEELQRKWASLWMMSQEQGLWPDRTLATEAESTAHLKSQKTAAEVPAHRFPEVLEIPVGEDVTEGMAEEEAAGPVELEADWVPMGSGRAELRILPDPSELVADEEPAALKTLDDVFDEPHTGASLRDLRLRLRFHRADFYLVVAIIVSTVAMIWVLSATPTPGAQHKPHLRLWERALIGVGLAEAPEAPPRRGNPNISVWVDPKTALYYCAGEELYGKAPGGHLATQGEAQLDQFEPAGRAPCE